MSDSNSDDERVNGGRGEHEHEPGFDMTEAEAARYPHLLAIDVREALKTAQKAAEAYLRRRRGTTAGLRDEFRRLVPFLAYVVARISVETD